MRRVVLGLLALAFIGMANLHLPLLQLCAWTGMIVNYSRSVPLAEAIGMTFDGDHPCPLCCAIRKEQTQPKSELSAAPAPDRGILFIASVPMWRPCLTADGTVPLVAAVPEATFRRPPVPPPRAAA